MFERTKVAMLLVALCAPPAAVAGEPPRSKSAATVRKPPLDAPIDKREIKIANGTFRVGQRVRLGIRDGVLKPEESKHARPLAWGPGQTGVVLRFIQRRTWSSADNKYWSPVPMAVVRWDAQTWYEWDIPMNRMKDGVVYDAAAINKMNSENGPPVKLPAFERPAYLESLAASP
jgi:hypothetical protein